MKPDLRADYKIRLYTGPKTLFFEVSMFRQRPGKMRQHLSMMFVPVAPPSIKYRFNVVIAVKSTIYVSIAARAMGIPVSDPCLTITGVQDEQGVRIMRLQFPKVFITFNHIVDGYGFHV